MKYRITFGMKYVAVGFVSDTNKILCITKNIEYVLFIYLFIFLCFLEYVILYHRVIKVGRDLRFLAPFLPPSCCEIRPDCSGLYPVGS